MVREPPYLSIHHPHTSVWLGVKEGIVAIERIVNTVNDIHLPSFPVDSLSLAVVAHILRLQVIRFDMTVETCSLLPIRPSITTRLVVLTTRIPHSVAQSTRRRRLQQL